MTDIAHFIQPKTVPVRSISLTKVDEHMPTHSMICGCDMCRYYESKRYNRAYVEFQKYSNLVPSRSMRKLLQKPKININNALHITCGLSNT